MARYPLNNQRCPVSNVKKLFVDFGKSVRGIVPEAADCIRRTLAISAYQDPWSAICYEAGFPVLNVVQAVEQCQALAVITGANYGTWLADGIDYNWSVCRAIGHNDPTTPVEVASLCGPIGVIT